MFTYDRVSRILVPKSLGEGGKLDILFTVAMGDGREEAGVAATRLGGG